MQIAELRSNLETQLREGNLPEALQAFLAAMPEGSETYRIVSALIARLNAANKERFRNTISFEEYQRRVDQISADCFDLLAGLKEADLQPPAPTKSSDSTRTGTVLYRVPGVMQLQRAVRCVVRVAVNEEAILENIVLDEHVELKSGVEISDVMSAELLDPEGNAFQISSLNARTQLIRQSGYTEWNFQVMPLREGIHQLLVKVSIMEIVPGFQEPIPREVTLLENVTILTDLPERQDADNPSGGFKPAGPSFAFQHPAGTENEARAERPKNTPPSSTVVSMSEPGATIVPQWSEPSPSSPAIPPPATVVKQTPSPVTPTQRPPAPAAPPQSAAPRRNLRSLAYILALLVLLPAATWAFAPDLPAWVNAHYLEGSPEAYARFIEKHPGSPRLEKAYFLRADKSGQLTDLRAYQRRFQEKGVYAAQVTRQIATLESRALDNIREHPDEVRIRQFTENFPETERLTELKEAAQSRAENRPELLAVLEEAYVVSVRQQPTVAKIDAYLTDFPAGNRLEEVETAARARPEVFRKVQPKLEEAYLKKMEENPTRIQSEQFIEKFPEPTNREKLEQILDKRPVLKQEMLNKLDEIKVERRTMRRDSTG